MNYNNKLLIALGIFATVLLVFVYALITNKNNVTENLNTRPVSVSKISPYIEKFDNYNKNFNQNEKQIKRNLSSQKTEIISDINYSLRDNSILFKEPNEIITDESINDLLNEIESEENTNEPIDESSIQLSLEENKIFAYVGHFNEMDAIRIIEYLKYLDYNAFLKIIDNKLYFVIVEFKEHEKAVSFVNWAKNNSFSEAKIISQ